MNGLKHDHLWAVVRYDAYQANSDNPRIIFHVLKVFLLEEEAIQEAERLNQLREKQDPSHDRSIYYVELTRIKKGILK